MIRNASTDDYMALCELDKHISCKNLEKKIKCGEVLVIIENEKIIGWLRYNYFWDEHPFMNMLYIIHGYRRRGLGKKLVRYWEEKMREEGYHLVMTSTQSNEDAQHFYRKVGYRDIGGFIFANDPLELMLIKDIRKSLSNLNGVLTTEELGDIRLKSLR